MKVHRYIFLTCLALLTCVALADPDDTFTFNLPAQPLADALEAYSSTTGIDVAARSELVSGRQAPAVPGEMTARAALERLVTGSGLDFRFSGPNSAAIVERTAESDVAIMNDDSGATDRLAETVFTGSEQIQYLERTAQSTLKLDVPIEDTPQSVVVVPQEVIEDQGATSFEDVYRNFSGVYESGNTLNARSTVVPVIRAFEAQAIFRNGLRATEVGTIDFFNIESVQALKGPASILFGALEPGGILNYVTKQPLDYPAYEIRQEFGSWDHYRTTLDAGGPLSADGRALYRFNAAYTNSGSFRNHVDLERFGIAPSVTWRLSDRTDLTFDFSYVKETVPYDTGVPFGFNDEPLVPIDTFFNDPDLEGRTLEDTFIGYYLEHRWNDMFTLRNRFQFHRAHPRNESIRPRGVRGTAGAEELRIRYQNEERFDDEYQFVTDLVANFHTGSVEHRAVVGSDLTWQDSAFDRFRQNLPNVLITDDPNVNFTPGPGSDPVPAFRNTLGWASVYAQDQMSFFQDGRLKLLVGGRYDYVESEQRLPSDSSNSDSAFTGRAGVLYELNDWVSPYASGSESFLPNSPGTVDRTGNVLDPETGLPYEAGLKFQFFDDRLQATVAAFDIEKQDVALFDQAHFTATGDVAFLPGVDQGSKGFEIDILGQITDDLSIVANYAYSETEILANETDPSAIGDPLGGVPEHSARLWLAYEFPDHYKLRDFGVGAGLRYESDRFANFDDTELQDFIVFDAGVWYQKTLKNDNELTARLNFQNIGDREYYPRASAQDIVHPGAPFGVFGSIGLTF